VQGRAGPLDRDSLDYLVHLGAIPERMPESMYRPRLRR
jgi:hypothetical protein